MYLSEEGEKLLGLQFSQVMYYSNSASAVLLTKLLKKSLLVVALLLQFSHVSEGQQAYVNNGQLDCYKHYNYTDGFVCNGPSSSCLSYLTFRSNPPNYDSAVTIGYLLGAEPSQIATINNVTDVEKIPKDTILIVPVNCSCGGKYYQHNSSYSLKSADETYFIVANNTYQGLTTCQAMMASNPSYDSRNLSADLDLVVPLMCACPTSNQTSAAGGGVKYLLTYLVTWYDSISSIAGLFAGVDQQSILDANQLSSDSLIYPFTPLLVPLTSVPTKIQTPDSSSPPAPSPPIVVPPAAGESNSSKKWVFIGVGIGAALLVLTISGFLFLCRRRRRRWSKKEEPISDSGGAAKKKLTTADYYPHDNNNNSWSISSEGIRYAIESLTVYKFEDLEMATGSFSESNRIKGSVYRGSFKGDSAAVKMMKGDVSSEINILKKINHGNIIRLSGYCLHQGNTYLVYEYAENGSLSDWLHPDKYNNKSSSDHSDHHHLGLGWKQRVQIGYDVADALNYIHNYSNPPYVHKNLKSSNILLDGNMRAKVANFGVARSMDQEEDEAGGMQLTRHVVGTHGYMAPEYIENGVITPKLDVFAFGVLILQLLSGREAASNSKNGGGGEELLSASIKVVLQGENVREKLVRLMDPGMRQEYPLDLAFSLAQLANNCVSRDLNSRPAMSEVHMTLSKILSSSLDWDPSDELDEHSRSLSHGR